MKREEVERIINKIAYRVYNVDPEEPDFQECAIKEEIEELLIKLGVTYDEE